MRRGLAVFAAVAIPAALCCAAPASASARSLSARPASQARPDFGPSDGSAFRAESCASATSCVAVGLYFNRVKSGLDPLAEQWDGHDWTLQHVPDAAHSRETFLNGVSCKSAKCIAVGYYIDKTTGEDVPLAERFDGHAWTRQRLPKIPGMVSAVLNAVACQSPTSCLAVGDYNTSSGVLRTLAERWNGHAWSSQRPVNPGPDGSMLNSVSCPAATSCTAVGDYLPDAATSRTLAERWNGHHWAVQHTPNPAGATQSYLNGVACHTTTACIAVGGSFSNSSSTTVTLAEGWNGHHWSIQHTRNPTGATVSDLSAVACHTTTVCTAVGASDRLPLAERWKGHSWAIQSTPALPSGGTDGGLAAVRCTSLTSCTAAGSYQNRHHVGKTLAEHWDGHAWAIQQTFNPTG